MATLDVQAFKRQQRKMFSKGADHGVVSPPLLGLPIRRVIPVDVHSVMDYAGGATVASAGWMSGSAAACTAGSALSAIVVGVSLFTDYRLSLKKLIPIEVHEIADYVWGASCILAPFVFGYAKKSKLAAWTHIVVGASTIIASLFTDYRGMRGVHWDGSPTSPKPVGA